MGWFWLLCRPKLFPRSCSHRVIFEKIICHEIERFLTLFGIWGAKMVIQNGTRSLQDGSEIVLDPFFCILIFRFVFESLSAPFWAQVGRPNGPQRVTPKCLSEVWRGSTTVLGSSCFGPCFVLRFGLAFWTLLGCSWGRLGAPLGPFLGRLGVSWVCFGVLRDPFG